MTDGALFVTCFINFETLILMNQIIVIAGLVEHQDVTRIPWRDHSIRVGRYVILREGLALYVLKAASVGRSL